MKDAFLAERFAALQSLDREQIVAYARKWGAWLPADERSFWGGVHKARLMLPGLSAEERTLSRSWLVEHGFRCDGLTAAELSRREAGREG